jgi:hypothetical protein
MSSRVEARDDLRMKVLLMPYHLSPLSFPFFHEQLVMNFSKTLANNQLRLSPTKDMEATLSRKARILQMHTPN